MDMTSYPLESYKFMILDVSKEPDPIAPCTKYPLKEYEIWQGTYMVQGMDRKAEPSLLGKEKGRSFQDACMRFFLKSEIRYRDKTDQENEYYDTKRWDYDPYRNTNWAVRLFETEREAWEEYKKF